MMLATYKCGCPPPPEKPPCSPCCASSKRSSRKREKVPVAGCSKTPSKTVVAKPKILQVPACCPTLPEEECETPRVIRSEIEEKGLPYKEIEAVINNNRLVIRTQREPVKPKYDPPCDCIEDSSESTEQTEEICEENDETPGNRTITLFPRVKDMSNGAERRNDKPSHVRLIDLEENPNIFLFRVKKKCADGDRRFDIDLEFKTARPWSAKKMMEHGQMRKSTTLHVDFSDEKSNAQDTSDRKK